MGCCESKMELPMKPVGLEGLYTFHDSKYNDGTDDIVVDDSHHGLTNLKKQPPKSCLRTPPKRLVGEGENGGDGERGAGAGTPVDPERPRTPSGLEAMKEASPSRGGEDGLSVRFKEELTEPAFKAYFRQRAEEEEARARVEESQPSANKGNKGSEGWIKEKNSRAAEEPYPRAG